MKVKSFVWVFAAVFSLIGLSGCYYVKTTPIVGPDNTKAFLIECLDRISPAPAKCYKKAKEICPDGYRFPEGYSATGGTGELVVVCKN